MTVTKIIVENTNVSSPEKKITTPKSIKTNFQRISRLLRLNSAEDQTLFTYHNGRNVSKSPSPHRFGITEDCPKKQLFQSSMPDVSFRSTKIPISWEFGEETEVQLPLTPETTDQNASVILRRPVGAKKTVRYSKSVFDDKSEDAVEVFPKCRSDVDVQGIAELENLNESKNHDSLDDLRNSTAEFFNRMIMNRVLNRPGNVTSGIPRRESNWSGYHVTGIIPRDDDDSDEDECDLRCPTWLDDFIRSPKYILLLIAVVLMIFGTTLLLMTSRGGNENSSVGLREFDYKLPRDLKPQVYEIDLVPRFWEGIFYGQIQMTFHVLSNTTRIVLHSANLNIGKHHTTVWEDKFPVLHPQTLSIKSQEHDHDREFFVIETVDVLQKGKTYVIYLKFSGVLRDDFRGFYRMSYRQYHKIQGKPLSRLPGFGLETNTHNFTLKWMGATSLEPIDARRVFPCLDEPFFKARFVVNIARLRNMTSFSNEPRQPVNELVSDLDNYVWDRYNKTDNAIPAYSLRLAVSSYDSHVHINKRGNISIWTSRDNDQQSTRYGLEIGQKLAEILDVKFRSLSSKVNFDLITVPNLPIDLENHKHCLSTGCSELELLHDRFGGSEENSAIAVAEAYTWHFFGSLTTPSNWNDFWITGALARYYAYHALDEIERNFQMSEKFVVYETQKALAQDMFRSNTPLQVDEVYSPSGIKQLYEKISYSKGASIIRMMNHVLDSQIFEESIKNLVKSEKWMNVGQFFHYINESAYWPGRKTNTSIRFIDFDSDSNVNNSVVNHKIFTEQMDIEKILNPWIINYGYPVVTVIRNYNHDSAHVTQERFRLLSSKNSSKNSLWWIPLTFTSEKKPNFNQSDPSSIIYIKNKESLITSFGCSSLEWIIFNVGQLGFYRVNYDRSNWMMIISYLRGTFEDTDFKKIPTVNRAQLVDDSANLARAGYLSYETTLDLMMYLERETDYLPWIAAVRNLKFMTEIMYGHEDYAKFKNFTKNLLRIAYRNLDLNSAYGPRSEILDFVCRFNIQDCVSEAEDTMSHLKAGSSNSEEITSWETRSIRYCTAVRNGDSRDWDILWKRYLDEKNHIRERLDVLLGLGCSENPELLSRYLDWAVRDENVQKQDVVRVFESVMRNLVGQKIVRDYLQENWEFLKNRFGPSSKVLRDIVKLSLSQVNLVKNKTELDGMAEILKDLGNLNYLLEIAVEEVESNVVWRKYQFTEVQTWMTQNL